jgi:hypothetical protein
VAGRRTEEIDMERGRTGASWSGVFVCRDGLFSGDRSTDGPQLILPTLFFLEHAPVASIAHDDEVENADLQHLGLAHELPHRIPVRGRRTRIAFGVIVDEDDVPGAGDEGTAKDVHDAKRSCTFTAYREHVIEDHFQVMREIDAKEGFLGMVFDRLEDLVDLFRVGDLALDGILVLAFTRRILSFRRYFMEWIDS